MKKVFIFDADRCNGCANCMLACKDEHCDNDWTPYAKPQQQTGQNWNWLDERERGQVPKVRVSYVLHMCQHCDDCALVAAAPECVYQRDDGLVIIDPEKATGRNDLVELCPHGAVTWNAQLDLPQKCTGCAHLLDDGWSVPRCVDSCATDALQFGEESDLDLEDAVSLPEVAGLGARVYYRNLPKRFAAGCVYDADAQDVLIGAQVELLDTTGGVVATQETDEFGDWMFDQIEPDVYEVRISCSGYPDTRVPADVTKKDLFTGDLGLNKA